jgi:hypothetical protein
VSSQAKPQKSHRIAVAAIFTLAVICAVIAVLSTYVKRQALDTNNWTNTSSRVLESKNVQNALGLYLVDQLFGNVDVAGQLQGVLPTQLQGLAGPASGALRQVADRAAPELLARPRVQDAWRIANRNAHKQLLQILNGGGKVVSTNNGEVVLDLHALVNQLATTLGVESAVAGAREKLNISPSPNAGRLVIMRAKQLKTAQDVAKLIRHLSIIFTILTFGLFALGIWLSAGRRRMALRTTGWCWVGVGIFVLLVRRLAGDWIVNGLVQAQSVKPAAHDSWEVGTSLLRAIAIAFVIYGLVVVLAATLAGPTRPALAVRRALAPSMRDHPLRIYGAAGLVYLLVLAWGPTPALRHWIPVLIIGALLALGIEILRRQTAREFPDAQSGDTMHSMRAWFDQRRGRFSRQAPADAADGGRVAELERLASLHDSGALTDEEYAAEKGLLLRS